MPKGLIDIALMYSFLKRLVTPFEEWDAFKSGVIDAEGQILIPVDKRSPEQRDSYGYYDRVVANLKKLLAKVPGGKTKLATFASALLLMREDKIPTDEAELHSLLEEYMQEFKLNPLYEQYLQEEIVNTVGSNIGAETVDNPSPRKKNPKILKRKLKKLLSKDSDCT